jgi:hypothetical protein
MKLIIGGRLRQERVSNELKKRGIFVSPGGMRSIWLRQDLENLRKRLKALETLTAANACLILTEAQAQALEKAKKQREAEEGIETGVPAIWTPKTPAMSARSRALGASTSGPSSPLAARSPLPNCIRRNQR